MKNQLPRLEKKIETTIMGLYLVKGNIGTMEKKMEATIMGFFKAAIPTDPPESQRHALSCLATYAYMLAERWIQKKAHAYPDRQDQVTVAGRFGSTR